MNLFQKIKIIGLAIGLIAFNTQLKSQCFDKHLNFNGNNQYVTVPNNIVGTLSGAYTIEFNLFWNGGNDWQRVFDFATTTNSGQQEYLIFTPKAFGGKAQFAITTGGGGAAQKLESLAPLTANVWHHIAIVHTPSPSLNTKLFIDGTLNNQVNTITLQPSVIGTTAQNYLGKSNFADPYLNGKVEEFRISNAARYTANFTIPTNEFVSDVNTVALYHFNEISGVQSITDFSSNVFNAFLGSSSSNTSNDPKKGYCNSRRIYVNVNASTSSLQTGTSWSNAYRSLENALIEANMFDTIWVAAGIYKPDTAFDRNKTFNLLNGMQVYGGFSGTESILAQRDFKNNPTILSGDIGIIGDSSDNTYNILTVLNFSIQARIDGFSIKNAYGAGQGGGINCNNSNLIVENCIFANSFSSFAGGGIWVDGSSSLLTVNKCVFINNSSNSQGGAINNQYGSTLLFNSLFINNRSGLASAVADYEGSVKIVNCTFYRNRATLPNSGVFVCSPGTISVEFFNNIFGSNTNGDIGYTVNATVKNNNVSGNYGNTTNITTNPGFSSIQDLDGTDNIWMTADDGLHLQPCSPSVNTGDSTFLPVSIVSDIVGVDRVQGTNVNMGAYENTLLSFDYAFTPINTTTCAGAFSTLDISYIAPQGKTANTFATGSAVDNRINVSPILGNAMLVNTQFTVEAWVKIESVRTWSRLFDFGGGQLDNNIILATSEGNDNLPTFAVYNGNVSSNLIKSSVPMPVGEWAHLAVTYNASSGAAIIYLNGVQVGSGTTNVLPINYNRIESYIGASAWNDRSNSSFDEFRVWNTILSATTISSFKNRIFNATHPNAANLIARYTFEGNANDVSPTALYSGSYGSAITQSQLKFLWNTGDTTTTITVAPLVNTNYIGSISEGSFCPLQLQAFNLTVNPLPVVIANTTSNAVCTGGSVTLSGSGALNYTWNNSIINGSSFVALTTNTYTITGTDANGCSKKDSVTITVNPLPIVTASASNDTICAGDAAIVNASGTATNYTWNNGVMSGVAFSPSSTNTYTVTGTDVNTCSQKDSIAITVNPNPVASLTAPISTLCVGTPATLTGLPAGGAYSVVSGSASALVGNTFNAATTGNYTIAYTYINAAGCSDSAQFNFNVNCILGLDNTIINNSSFIIFPNPNNGVFTISSTIEMDENIELINELGQVVYKNRMNGLSKNIDLAHLSAGIYYVKVSNGTSTSARKINIIK
jgi:Concanavalin A-like lectin/glucanases superfamily/Secretion system C-terminal sorting domain